MSVDPEYIHLICPQLDQLHLSFYHYSVFGRLKVVDLTCCIEVKDEWCRVVTPFDLTMKLTA